MGDIYTFCGFSHNSLLPMFCGSSVLQIVSEYVLGERCASSAETYPLLTLSFQTFQVAKMLKKSSL